MIVQLLAALSLSLLPYNCENWGKLHGWLGMWWLDLKVWQTPNDQAWHYHLLPISPKKKMEKVEHLDTNPDWKKHKAGPPTCRYGLFLRPHQALFRVYVYLWTVSEISCFLWNGKRAFQARKLPCVTPWCAGTSRPSESGYFASSESKTLAPCLSESSKLPPLSPPQKQGFSEIPAHAEIPRCKSRHSLEVGTVSHFISESLPWALPQISAPFLRQQPGFLGNFLYSYMVFSNQSESYSNLIGWKGAFLSKVLTKSPHPKATEGHESSIQRAFKSWGEQGETEYTSPESRRTTKIRDSRQEWTILQETWDECGPFSIIKACTPLGTP